MDDCDFNPFFSVSCPKTCDGVINDIRRSCPILLPNFKIRNKDFQQSCQENMDPGWLQYQPLLLKSSPILMHFSVRSKSRLETFDLQPKYILGNRKQTFRLSILCQNCKSKILPWNLCDLTFRETEMFSSRAAWMLF